MLRSLIVYGIRQTGTKGSDASDNHYGRQTVKMDNRICNYFIFPLYFKQWTSVTLTEDYCSHLTMQIQLDVAAGRTAARVNMNATMAPDRKTSTRKHLRGMYQKQEYLQTWRIYFASYCCRLRDIVLLAFRSEPSLGCGSAAWIQYAGNKNLAEQEAVSQFFAGLHWKRLWQGASVGAALVVLYTCCVVVSRAAGILNTHRKERQRWGVWFVFRRVAN